VDVSDAEIADLKSVSAEEAIVERETHEQLRAALSQLPESNRLLIEEYYFRDATFAEIGARLGLSKSWVCRLHAKSLEMLRDIVRNAGPLMPRKNCRILATSQVQVR
jgi:RNA polymerase sigma factor for flagellar operon FliA